MWHKESLHFRTHCSFYSQNKYRPFPLTSFIVRSLLRHGVCPRWGRSWILYTN
jgi:hypothetical protein